MQEQSKTVPHFILVGAMKAGTTSLRFHLNNHPHIHLPQRELNFFNNQKNFNRALAWYQEQIAKDAKDSATLFGEKSPAYTLEEFVPKRMHELLPDAKLIWVLRNPVDRTYSNYLHELKLGLENLSFNQALNAEPTRAVKTIKYAYTTNSMYSQQIERFLEFYPKSQCFFVLFDDLIKPYGSTHVLNDLFNFLGVDTSTFNYVNGVRNKTTLPRYPKLLFYANRWGLTKSWKIKKALNTFNFKNQKPGYPKLTQTQRAELAKKFEPHNAKLSALIGKDLSGWNR